MIKALNGTNAIKIKDKIFLVISIVFTITVLFLSTTEYKNNMENQYYHISSNLEQYSENTKVSIEDYVNNKYNVLEYIASFEEIKGMNWDEQRRFLSAAEKYLDFEHLIVVDINGTGYYSNTGEIRDHSKEVFSKNVLSNSRYITEPYMEGENLRSITTISVSIYNGDMKVGALCGVIDLQKLYDLTSEINDSSYYSCIIINKYGEYIAHKNMEFVHNKERVSRHLRTSNTSELNEVLYSKTSTQKNLKINNKNYYVQSVPLDSVDWHIILLSDISNLSEKYKIYILYILIATIGFSSTVILGYNLVNKLIRNRKLACTDFLTKINNRAVFNTAIEKLENKKDISTAIINFDLNNFKYLNDNFGHKAGDEILVEFASIIKRTFVSDALVSRIGGDEFVVILIDTSIYEIEEYISKIEELIELYNRRSIYTFSMSYGYAIRGRGEDVSLKDICEEADENMYKYKKQIK